MKYFEHDKNCLCNECIMADIRNVYGESVGILASMSPDSISKERAYLIWVDWFKNPEAVYKWRMAHKNDTGIGAWL